MFLVVAFYTVDTPYEKEIQGLIESCEDHDLQIYTKGYESRGTWVENAGIKPEFLLEMMETHKKDLLYLDADARIRKMPDFSDVEDIGVHYRHGRELLSGTIYLRYNERVLYLLREWICLQRSEPSSWDQRVLQRVVKFVDYVKVTDLPPQYTQIFDTMAHHGEPVIEHMQASRRFKKTIKMTDKIPAVIGKSRLRQHGDGSVSILRRDRIAETYLDKHMDRVKRELRWYPKFIPGTSDLASLQPIFSGKRCYIVGKGPSLDRLTKKDFPDTRAPIIALNEAVLEVEKLDIDNPIFGLQQDAALKDTCYPETAGIFVSQKAIPYYADKPRGVFAFSSLVYGLSLNCLSVISAIAIARSLGSKGFYFLCFDACVNKNTDYAKSVPYTPTFGGDPKRFLKHKARILAACRGLTVGWAIPR